MMPPGPPPMVKVNLQLTSLIVAAAPQTPKDSTCKVQCLLLMLGPWPYPTDTLGGGGGSSPQHISLRVPNPQQNS